MNTPKTMSDEEALAVIDACISIQEIPQDFSDQLLDKLRDARAHISARLEAAEKLAISLNDCANKLAEMGAEFIRSNFTDRHGNGPRMKKLSSDAYALLKTYRSLTP